jgi:hypothetical protein
MNRNKSKDATISLTQFFQLKGKFLLNTRMFFFTLISAQTNMSLKTD